MRPRDQGLPAAAASIRHKAPLTERRVPATELTSCEQAWRHEATLLACDIDLDRVARVIGVELDLPAEPG
jgi:hypothetical protein